MTRALQTWDIVSQNEQEKAWRTFHVRKHFVVKPKKTNPKPNLNP